MTMPAMARMAATICREGGREGDSVSPWMELQVPENGNVLLVGFFQVDRGGSWVSCRGHLSKLSLTKIPEKNLNRGFFGSV